MSRSYIQILLVVVGFSIVSVVRFSGDGDPSRSRDVALVVGLLLTALGVGAMLLEGLTRRTKPLARSRASARRLPLQLAARVTVAILVIVVPLAVVDLEAGVVALGAATIALVAVGIWHKDRADKRGVPADERWRIRHERTLELPVPLDRALAIAKEAMRADLDLQVERVGEGGLVGEQAGRGGSRTRITATAIPTGDDSTQMHLASQPVTAVLDGGRSWEALASLERSVLSAMPQQERLGLTF